MFNKKKQPPLRSLIAEGARVSGDIFYSDGLRVECEIFGNIHPNNSNPSILVISEFAVVVGSISADHIIVNGRIQGNVMARLMLEVQPSARIEGDVQYGSLELHQGALVNGRLTPLTGEEGKPILAVESNPA